MLVESTRSQNSTVRWRRSPVKLRSRVPASARIAAAANGVPHLPQKFEAGGPTAPHFTQILTSAFPHCAQKSLSGELFDPHCAQRISSPVYRLISFIIWRCPETTARRRIEDIAR